MRRTPNDTPRLAVVQRADGSDDDAIAVEGIEPLLPEGEWIEARFVGHETREVFKTPKVVMRFQIVAPGEFFGRELERHFRTRKVLDPKGRDGKFVLNQRSDLFPPMVKLLDEKGRPDRITLRPLKHMLFRIRPRTVKHDHRQHKRPEAAWYSVCGDIERGE